MPTRTQLRLGRVIDPVGNDRAFSRPNTGRAEESIIPENQDGVHRIEMISEGNNIFRR